MYVFIIYNNEFSARLSIASILRLRGAALTAVSQDTAESTITSKLASRFLFLSKCEKSKDETKIQNLNSNSHAMVAEDGNLQDHNSEYRRSNELALFFLSFVHEIFRD
ncbi:unnamed protein product [Thlaspi arvense]|uniref:Uncharacterized protein n=1 Tax=Thlaspi arvense TaxID=13288 RepID=A0AAU9RGT4_THLAR|nr:unnamed protein product [Thlaspi arvense]